MHKSFLLATTINIPADSLQPSYQKKRFSTFNSDLNRFADWLHENACLDTCMESTGKYWVPVFNILEKRCICAVIARLRLKNGNMHNGEEFFTGMLNVFQEKLG